LKWSAVSFRAHSEDGLELRGENVNAGAAGETVDQDVRKQGANTAHLQKVHQQLHTKNAAFLKSKQQIL